MLPLLVMTPSLTGAWGDHKLDYCARSCTIVDEENVKLKFKTFIYALGVVFPTLMLIIFNIMIYARVSIFTVDQNFFFKKSWPKKFVKSNTKSIPFFAISKLAK